MNKRIKQKVAKRIINKIGTEQPLTKFERKSFIKFFWTPLRKEVANISESITKETNSYDKLISINTVGKSAVKEKINTEFEKEFSDLQEAANAMRGFGSLIEDDSWPKSAYEDLLSVGRGKDTFETVNEDSVDSLKYAVVEDVKPIIVRHPSKWNKLKGKMKGWFGK